MSVSQVLLPSSIELSNLAFTNVKPMGAGGKSVGLLYNGKPLVFQISNLNAPYGLNENVNDNGDVKLSLVLSLNSDPDDDVSKLMNSLDRKAMQEFYINCGKWCNRTVKSFDTVESLYSPIVKPSKDEKYPPTFKVQIPSKNGKVECDVYDADRNKVNDPLSLNWKGAKMSAIVQCNGLWIIGNKFGITFRVVQLKIAPRAKISGYAFVSDPEEVSQ